MRNTLMVAIGVVVAVVVLAGLLVLKFLGKDRELIGKKIGEAANAIWFVWCLLRTTIWKLRFQVRHQVLETAVWVVMLGSAYLVVHFAVGPLQHLVEAGFLTLPSIPKMPGVPFVGEIGLMLLALFLVRHNWREWKVMRQRWNMPAAIRKSLAELEALPTSATPADQRRKAYFDQLMERILSVLQTRNTGKLAVSFMEKTVDHWKVTFSYPPKSGIDDKVTLLLGEGGAGAAADTKAPVYIPSTRHLVVIDMSTFEMLGVTYKLINKDEAVRSMICIPVMTGTDVTGILNVGSVKRSAFSVHDIGIAELASEFMSALDWTLKTK